MPKVMESAHIVVLPSYYGEGLPKVLIEAAACGRAVVTTDHPGCRDAIEPDVSGLWSLWISEALADAIEKLLNDPIRCSKMGHAGRVLAENAFDEKTGGGSSFTDLPRIDGELMTVLLNRACRL